MNLHLEALGRSQRTVLKRLASFTREAGFYLGGGTGLALQLGHRRSVDFDWFCDKPLGDPLRLASDIAAHGVGLSVRSLEKGTLHANASGVRLSFLEYRYPLLRPPLSAGEPPFALASLEDLAAMKLSAVAQRGSRKDFVDIYALGRELGLPRMLDLYRRKYSVRDVGHVLVALTFFDDADREPMPSLIHRWRWESMRAAIRGWVRALVG